MSYREARPLPPGQRLESTLVARTYGPVPAIDPEDWTLDITGETASGEPMTVRLADLEELGRIDVEADLHCVSKATCQDLRWSGYSAHAVMALCPPAPGVEHVLAVAQHGYSSTVTVSDLASPRSILATHLDGEPLTAEHGAPVRLVLPHLYGFKGPKWVRELCYTSFPERGFWEQRGYHVGGDAWRQERYAYQE